MVGINDGLGMFNFDLQRSTLAAMGFVTIILALALFIKVVGVVLLVLSGIYTAYLAFNIYAKPKIIKDKVSVKVDGKEI
jgi:hypothetical protein